MKYLLDTNTCVRYINGRSLSIRHQMQALLPSDIAISIITVAELYYESAKSNTPIRSREKQKDFLRPFKILLFDGESAEIYADIRANLSRLGLLIGGNDLLIATIAIQYNLILVTHNTHEFQRIHQLRLDDWEK